MSDIALSISGLVKHYKDVHALKGVDLEVRHGDFFALLGPNGAGKSTLIGIIASLVNKTSGRVGVYGYDADAQPAHAKAQLGLVPQEFNFNQFEKVEDIILQQAGYFGISKAKARPWCHELLKKLDLFDKRSTQSMRLSGGMKRRLMIARALIHKPRLLILDEPTAGVDIEIRRAMWDFMRNLNREGATIILTTHYLEEAESLCRNIAIINHGEIIENTSMRKLLRKLDCQTYILDTDKPLMGDPPAHELVHLRKIDETCLEASFGKSTPLNTLFDLLDQHGIGVTSMRTASNRLEELFINLTRRPA